MESAAELTSIFHSTQCRLFNLATCGWEMCLKALIYFLAYINFFSLVYIILFFQTDLFGVLVNEWAKDYYICIHV